MLKCNIYQAMATNVYISVNLEQTAHYINGKRVFACSVVILAMRSWYIYGAKLQHNVYFCALAHCYGMA